MSVKILVPVSGGKDSQACLKMAVEQHGAESVRGLFCDTQFEHPVTYSHIEKLRTMYGPVQIDVVTGGSVLEKVVKHGRWPGGGARHCTDELKIRETKIYAKALAMAQGAGFEVWYGMRLKESNEREHRYAGKVGSEVYAPHEIMPSKYPKYLAALGVSFRLAVLEWTDADVVQYVGLRDLNPLYLQGFPRVGCFPCMASGKKWKRKAFAHDEFGRGQWQRVEFVSRQINKDPYTGEPLPDNDNDDMGCMVCAM